VAQEGRLSDLATPDSVRKLQTALHAKAKAEPEFRFYLLYDKVYRGDVLSHAYDRCKANGGAAGVDGQSFADIEASGVTAWLGELAKELRGRTYRPEAVRRVFIPKPNSKKKRPLGIATIRDRVAQTAAMMVLEPIFEADLQPEQHAYRAGISALDAVGAVHRLLNTGHTAVVDADLRGYFDEIPHGPLMKSVARRVSDRHMLHLIKMWIEAPVEETDERGNKRRTTRNRDEHRGIPQGSPISPLLSNLYMRRLVLWWKTSGTERRLQAVIVNYADDLVICCKDTAAAAMQVLREVTKKLDLAVNEEKTRICRVPEESFVHVRTVSLAQGRTGLSGHQAVAEEHQAPLRRDPRRNGATHAGPISRRNGQASQLEAPRVGQLLPSRAGHPGLSDRGSARQLSAAPVVEQKASGGQQGNQTVPRSVPLQRAGTGPPHAADARPAVGEGMMARPRAGCGKSARPVR
jgi:group II intron reverse transcriptase/maturase